MSVPIATSPDRSGFGPQLNLTYDSGSGNGPFGFGWSLSLPSITRKTDKGLPKYHDAQDSDVFILSGAEDLVPVLVEVNGQWVPESVPPRTLGEKTYQVRRYRPRVEGLFARIERWTNADDSGDVFWRSISKDNITTWYGKTSESRIADPNPNDPTRIFSWLICQSYDDKGNAIIYEYAQEDEAKVNLTKANERNRVRRANCYLKRIKYGNRTPNLDSTSLQATDPTRLDNDTWMFEVVFDYGEGHYKEDAPDTDERVFSYALSNAPDGTAWPVRQDAFSSYRAGFEVRTYRLCRRTLMFHHFPADDELGIDDCLIRSTEFSYEESPIASFITRVTQSGFVRQPAGGSRNRYFKRSLPPLEFEYSKVPSPEELAQQPILEVDTESLENLPIGLDGAVYQWLDLDGEGTSGVLTEQGNGWYYKRNLSPNNVVPENGHERTIARLGLVELVTRKPAAGLGEAQFVDLAGDGQADLAQMEGPVRGFYERTEDADWSPMQPFLSWPDVDTRDPNTRLVDLTGDGHTDILITEGEALTWYPSLAEAGFGSAVRVSLPLDEEKGPRLIFADSEQSIHLADLSGDGLTDLVRIRNGEVCYWPNLGYGHFGAKVTMDHAPWFDAQDQFDLGHIRLADTDGSGVTDILYLGRDGVRIYFNQSGNSWSDAVTLPQFPQVNSISSVQALDLLGNGTACLVWSSSLPGSARQPMLYLPLMEQKPHLLVKMKNNLGAETVMHYASSTKFYLQDKHDGQPWVSRLPFPVHVVEKVTVRDKWRHTSFSSTYSYHHGYFDGIEREFRGFGRVDQVDSEAYGKFLQGNIDGPYITPDQSLYQPPVKTVTWYHTGALLNAEQVLAQYEHEYFPHWFENMRPEDNVLGDFKENILPEPDLNAENLTADEWREALRACKGMLLRQEIYELDVDALEKGEERPVKLFSSAYHNCHIRPLQPRGQNQHAVFLVTESEAITYHYELDLTQETVRPDPRIAHTLNLEIDEYGNILQSVAAVYPRLGQFEDDILPADSLELIRQVQQERHLAYTETRYTADYDPIDPDNYRLRVPCEVLTYELPGISPEDADDLATADTRDNFYFMLDELRRLQISTDAVPAIAYEELPNQMTPQKRLVEHVQMLFFVDNPNDPGFLKDPLALAIMGRLALPYETYKLALTDELLNKIFTDEAGNKLDKPIKETLTARDLIRDQKVSGYKTDTNSQYWICSGRAGFGPDAALHFYLPERYTDPFGNTTTLKYDVRDLFVESSRDALNNVTSVEQFDFRVLAPRTMKDMNGNLSDVYFDALGLPVAMALKGKGEEADNLDDITDDLANPKPTKLISFFDMADLDVDEARNWLQGATARHIYYFGDDTLPPCACGILREEHSKENSRLQVAFEYSDGMGSVLVKKVQAEPETPGEKLRWVESGKVILNNKGKPVKQFEPKFSDGHRYVEQTDTDEMAVIVMYYDAPGRLIRTEVPDGSYSRVEFSPWHVTSFDQNDTAYNSDPDLSKCSDWYRRRMDPGHEKFGTFHTPENVRAATSVQAHENTPELTIADSLGREVVSVAHNRVQDTTGNLVDEKHLTFTKMDAEGKPLWIRDARRNLVMQYITPPVANNQATDPMDGFVPCYDIAGNLLYQHSMDAGDRWTVNDSAGKPMCSWDSRGHTFRTEYDALHRLTGSFVRGADPDHPDRELQFEKIIYGESQPQAQERNLRGKPFQHFDTAGKVQFGGYDFKGNLLESRRELASDYTSTPDWSQSPDLEQEFITTITYDALNRPMKTISPDKSIYHPSYNEASLLERIDVELRAPGPATPFVTNIDYNARGQRTRIQYNRDSHRIVTTYEYDDETFRLTHLVTTRPPDLGMDHNTLQDLFYTYDPVGNITHIADRAQQRVFFDNECINPSNDYLYDALYRLIAAKGREHRGGDLQPDWDDSPRTRNLLPGDCIALQNYVELYRYDPVGNILRMEHHKGDNLNSPGTVTWNRRYQYALDSNRLLATSVPSDPDGLPDYTDNPSYSAKYIYGVHGSITSMPHLPEIIFDFKDQLQSVEFLGGGEAFYVYDASGQRVRKVTHNQNGIKTKERIYLGGYEIYRVYNGAGNTTPQLERETLHIMDDNQRIALVETKTIEAPSPIGDMQPFIRYQLSNHLGSSIVEVSDQTQVISYEEYYPYGSTSYQAMGNQAETPKRYRYTRKERDEENGFYYHGARYYAAWLGRWINPDPVGIEAGINLYHYVSNNPVINSDPTGEEEITIHHRTDERAAASMAKRGVRTDVSSARSWAGSGFYGLDTPQITGSGAKGDVIVAQKISTDKMVDLDQTSRRPGIGARITDAMQETDHGRRLRTEIWRQLKDQGNQLARTLGGKPSDAAIDKWFRDYMNTQLKEIAPDAEVIKWKNNDGTTTYVVKKQSALVGKPTIVGRMKGGSLVPQAPASSKPPVADTNTPKPKRTSAGRVKGGSLVPKPPASSKPPVADTNTPKPNRTSTAVMEDSPSRKSVTEVPADTNKARASRAGRRVLMGLPVVDVFYQQFNYNDDTAYTGYRVLDAGLNLTVANLWETPIALYTIFTF